MVFWSCQKRVLKSKIQVNCYAFRRTAALAQAVEQIKTMEEMVSFDEKLWAALVEYATVARNGSIIFTLRGGIDLIY